MDFSLGEGYDLICKVVNSGVSVKQGMEALIKYSNDYSNNMSWKNVLELDFDNDEKNLLNWLEQVLKVEPPSKDIKKLWFGLFDGIYDGNEQCILYISGSSIESNEDIEELDFEEEYLPDDRYADSKILYQISSILKTQDKESKYIGEYILYLGYTCLVIQDIFKRIDENILDCLDESCKITVGFDSGDYVDLGILKNIRIH
ncbi:hypothetical protein [Clostridium sp. YIM B02551]|uniref:hypothetical protein n=1 Tax=Clostridium sp. YIM B02551 TaxID=2910679 RepID=UPI001EE9D189|nr:hypothetical protein [Clostridium sp. YIM B02551]